jgi:hypothetical protein
MAATGFLVASQIGGAIAQASAARAQGEFRRTQADINSRFAELQAEQAIKQGDKQAQEFDKRVRQTVGAQRAALAAQGIDIDDGIALEIQEEAAMQGAIDSQTIRNNAWRQAFGFEQQSVQHQIQGQVAESTAEFQAQSSLITGALGAAGTIIGGFEKKG